MIFRFYNTDIELFAKRCVIETGPDASEFFVLSLPTALSSNRFRSPLVLSEVDMEKTADREVARWET
jgi:hypothetical protein